MDALYMQLCMYVQVVIRTQTTTDNLGTSFLEKRNKQNVLSCGGSVLEIKTQGPKV